MASKITFFKYTVHSFKAALLVGMLCSSMGAFSQIFVESVEPRTVTTDSRIIITSTVDLPVIQNISIGQIYQIKGKYFYLNSPTVGTLWITRNELYAGDGVSPSNDLVDIPLIINKKTVHIGNADEDDATIDNQVFITYIAPKAETLTSDKSFFVEEIYTNWDYNASGFWRSGFYKNATTELERNAAAPDNKHQLLGYKMNKNGSDIIYSTGVDDPLLEEKLALSPGADYVRNVFKAYSTNGVRGKTSGDNFIIAGDMIDGIDGLSGNESLEDFENSSKIKEHINDLTILEAIISGKHGLELGIGVTNFKSTEKKKEISEIKFFSGNGTLGAINDDGAPDLLITQIADAQGHEDLYYYSDELGNVIGRPIKLKISDRESTDLAKWKVNLYSFETGLDFGIATPNGRGTQYINDRFRPIKMAAFKLEDFGIDSIEQVEIIENVTMIPGGQADIAFMAYNEGSFELKGPVAKTILPQFICRVDGSAKSKAIFTVIEGKNVGIEDYEAENNIRKPKVGDSSEELSYQLLKGGLPITDLGTAPSSLTVPKVQDKDLGIYKLFIKNDEGSVIVPVELAEGGTPFLWDGGKWNSPYGDQVPQENRSLIFTEDYNGQVDLEGCDCTVKAGTSVTIEKGKSFKLYNSIVVEDRIEIVDENGEGTGVFTEAGTFTLENNASLIQTKDVAVNQNSGDIIVERIADGLKKYDYVYWSSPVEDAELSMIPGATSHVYQWEVNEENSGVGRGNWVRPSNQTMDQGRGYIKRVNNSDIIHSRFTGTPANGDILVPVIETIDGTGMDESEQDWNLIGNPYPSAINPDMLLDQNRDRIEQIQIWKHESTPSSTVVDPFYENFKLNYDNDYLIINSTASTDPSFNGYIASGQGFMVKTTNGGDVKFTNAMRYDASTGKAHNNTGFYRGTAEVIAQPNETNEKQLIWLALTDETRSATVSVIGYVENATNGKDRLYDAGSGPGDMRIYSQINDQDFLIQGRALPFQETDEVPLGIEVLKNGIYNIGIDHLKGSRMLNEDQGIYLEDTYNNVVHNLRAAPYGFTASKGNVKDRFVLRYTDGQLSVEDQELTKTFVYVKNGQLYVKASKNIASVVVYDLTGKKIMDYTLEGQRDRFNTPFQYAKGAYLTVVTLENNGRVTKKVLH